MNESEQFSPDELSARSFWLIQHPQFEEKPATINEFLGPDYLNISSSIRPGVRQALIDIFGDEVSADVISTYQKAIITGAIGIGKSTIASIGLPYMVHWVLCLRDPQDFFSLIPGSRIAFMMMSTSEKQAREVLFGDVFARIKHSKWFKDHPYDPGFTRQIKFDKDINILPGDSKETTFEGYNILGGVIDEIDSHTVTKDKDYADVGFDTIENRMTSRFGKRGLVICIGQMKKAVGFAARKFAEFSIDPEAYANLMSIWESLGWDWKGDPTTRACPFLKEDGSRDSFYYDHKRRTIIPQAVGALLPASNTIIEIPNYYRRAFERQPEKALKDLAGIPPKVSDPFISLVDRIEFCRELWIARYFPDAEDLSGDLSEFSPVTASSLRPEFKKWFTNKTNRDLRRRAIHVDIGYSGDGDALGLAMGHIAGLKDDGDGEEQPIICFDFLMRIKAPAGSEIFLPDVRRIIYHLRDELGFRIQKVTYDGFESQEAVQQLRRRRFEVDKVSVDKSTLPYEDMRDAIYGGRCEFPPYVTEFIKGEADSYVEIAVKELSELQHDGRKVDHPPTGSKDLTDAMAGVTHELIGDRRYRRGVHSLHDQSETDGVKNTDWTKLFDRASNPLPLPQDILSKSNKQTTPGRDMGIIVPEYLLPRNR